MPLSNISKVPLSFTASTPSSFRKKRIALQRDSAENIVSPVWLAGSQLPTLFATKKGKRTKSFKKACTDAEDESSEATEPKMKEQKTEDIF